MQTGGFQLGWCGVVCALALALFAAPGQAARIGVVSNQYAPETALDFNNKVPGHVFTAVDVSTKVPTLASLTSSFDAILLFEDGTFTNAPAVGDLVAAYARSGRAVVIGTFYDEDRSDGPPAFTPHGWGQLETIDPNLTDGTGTPYAPRTLDAASIVTHPLTTGLTRLSSNKYAGGNQAKPGTVVLATYTQKNAKGGPDPVVDYRITGAACVVHVAIAPNYATIGVFGADFDGDFYRLWRNAFDYASGHCGVSAGDPQGPESVPTLSGLALVATALLLAVAGGLSRRRRPQ